MERERFFIINSENLIELYKRYLDDIKRMDECFREFAEEHGIETTKYYQSTCNLHIIPTDNDLQKFSSQIRKNTDGNFKNNSKIGKEWIATCKEKDLHTPYKPVYDMARALVFEPRFRSRMFMLNGVLYGSYAIDWDWELSSDDFQELKASEFWKIVEEAKEFGGNK